ncbi:MAG: site-specific integrase [Verrucomicrobiota bacterium]
MEGVYLRGKTYWFRFRPAEKAAQVRINLRTGDEMEAIAAARKIKARPHAHTATGSLTEWIGKYIAHKKRKGCTEWWMQNLRLCLEEAAEYFDPSPRRVTQAQARAWQEGITSGDRYYKHRKTPTKKPPVNARTAATYAAWVKPFFVWLIQEGVILKSPFEGIEVPKTSPALRKVFLSREQALLALNARTAVDGKKAVELRFCLFAALHAGLRKAEVIACRPKWFDLEAGLLHIQNEEDFLIKDRENRTVPLTPEFLAFLKEYGLRSPYMLAPDAVKGRGPYRFNFKYWFDSHMLALGLEEFTFHDLRRTFASLLVSSGVSCYKVAKWLGDGIEIVERHYGHLIANDSDINRSWSQPSRATVSDESMRKAAEGLPDLMG